MANEQQPDVNQIANQIAQALQKGANPAEIVVQLIQQGFQPEQIVGILTQAGLPQDQAVQTVQEASSTQQPGQPQMALGGEFLKLFKKALGGTMETPVSQTSNSYLDDRLNVFTSAIKKNLALSTLDDLMSNKVSIASVIPKADKGADLKAGALSLLGITEDQYNSNSDYKNRIDTLISTSPDVITKAMGISQKVISEPSTEMNSVQQVSSPNTYYQSGNGVPIQFVRYQDPRTQVPMMSPLGRVFNQYFNPTGYHQSGFKSRGLPQGFNANELFDKTVNNNNVSSVETFRKGLFGNKVGVRFNFDPNNQSVQNSPTQSPSEDMVYYKGTLMSAQEAEFIKRNTEDQMENLVGPVNQIQENPNNQENQFPSTEEEFKALLKKQVPFAATGWDGSQKSDSYFEATYKPNVNSGDIADVAMNGAEFFTSLFNKARSVNPERDAAFYSAANEQPRSFSEMSRGFYDQQGNFIPTDLGNQVLNPTNSFGNSLRTYSLGGDPSAQMGPGDPPTKEQIYQATLDYLNANPITNKKGDVLEFDKLQPVRGHGAPKMIKSDLLIPGVGTYKQGEYQPAAVPEGYIGLPIYIVNGKPVVTDEKFNKEFFNMYKDSRLGADMLYPIYGQGTPYKALGGEIDLSSEEEDMLRKMGIKIKRN